MTYLCASRFNEIPVRTVNIALPLGLPEVRKEKFLKRCVVERSTIFLSETICLPVTDRNYEVTTTLILLSRINATLSSIATVCSAYGISLRK